MATVNDSNATAYMKEEEDRKTRKLIDRVDILKDLDENVAPIYYPDVALDKSRIGLYGMILEAMANSIEDTITLEQRRATDYCPELSSSEIHVNQTAKIRNIGVTRAEPGQCFALLMVLKSDILAKGVPTSDGVTFIIDRRSTILYGGVNFSLEDDIIIRAVKRANGSYLYAANYTGEHSSYESYIQMYEYVNTHGEELVAMICQIYQFKYNIQEKHVTDDIEFLYDGLYFDYDNQLADFEVYFKRSSNDDYTQADLDHYLTMINNQKVLFYNDDESNLLRIYNNPTMNIGVNSVIRVEMKETLGTDGEITIDANTNASFSMYRDAAYNYAGVHVFVTMLSDVVAASDGDSLTTVKKRLIDEKTRRDNITTEHDIITYINDVDANVQLVKKRNDIQDRNYFMYVLMRYGDRQIAPATTKRLNLTGVQSVLDLGDFDRYDPTVDRKIIRAYSKFKLHIVDGYPDYDYVTKCPLDENEPDTFYLTCPYMILINDLNIAYYYFTSVDTDAVLSMQQANNLFPYQMITRAIHIYRDAHNKDTHDIYTFTIKGSLNTENDSLLIDEDGNIIDRTMVMCHVVIPLDGSPAAYMPLEIDSYDPTTREFTFTGTMRTTDFITENDKLEVIYGLYRIGTKTNYNSVIDYKESSFQVYFLFKQDDPDNDYGRSDTIYSILPTEYTDGYIMMNAYYNNPNNLYNLVLEFAKFSRSPCTVTKGSETTYNYSIGAVPFFEFNFGCEYTASLYETFLNMTIVYGSLLKMTTDFEVALKFIATYGPSKYITVTGGRTENGGETTEYLNTLTPTIYFKVYGFGAPVDEIRAFIYEYLRDTYITEEQVFMSNVCTLVENTFEAVRSIKFMGIGRFDGSYQEFTYNKPVFVSRDIVTRYVPEQLNVTDIEIDLDETTDYTSTNVNDLF